MGSIRPDLANVLGVDEVGIDVSPGDLWPLPYRGSRYTVRKIGGRLRICWVRLDVVHPSDDLPAGFVKAMGKHKRNTRGRIVVTPHREVVARRESAPDRWESVYLGRLDGSISFPGFDLDPVGIEVGNLWPGLHFTHGEEFAVWNRDGNNDYLYWSKAGVYFRSTERYPELCAEVRRVRPRCGRVYFTETGHVWMNLPGGEVSHEFKPRFRDLLQQDMERLSDPSGDILLQSIVERVRATGCYPIYLGRINDYDSGVAPRTHFSSGARFGMGGEDMYDGDVFDSKYWKRMTRDQ